ncbi:hypothetical protein [Veronia pacifica]|uniref:Uncharacterized protein n=1 Tax=Veronia pacifica TaxID=1080227 RepID=A0A1C3EJ96_9GAMM|nr:hypothetical protein [Veronia pacifica]ODA33298.1 hypothetical protein A8L45_10895 [Veronia pacifica]
MKDIKAIFRNLEKMLTQASWFEDGWEIYNRGPYLQLYKENWHNQNQGGIHFETYIEAPQIKQKAFPVCMHAEEDCPEQSAFIEAFLAYERRRIESWKGYKISGKGYDICQRSMPLNTKGLEQRIFEELNRLRQLEHSVDKVLSEL